MGEWGQLVNAPMLSTVKYGWLSGEAKLVGGFNERGFMGINGIDGGLVLWGLNGQWREWCVKRKESGKVFLGLRNRGVGRWQCSGWDVVDGVEE